MTRDSGSPAQPIFLGIEGGGTRTVALLTHSDGKVLRRLEAGPANLKLLTDAQLIRHLRSLATASLRPNALAIGLAGAWAESDRQRIRQPASGEGRSVRRARSCVP